MGRLTKRRVSLEIEPNCRLPEDGPQGGNEDAKADHNPSELPRFLRNEEHKQRERAEIDELDERLIHPFCDLFTEVGFLLGFVCGHWLPLANVSRWSTDPFSRILVLLGRNNYRRFYPTPYNTSFTC